jgi:predicted secreted protein
MVKKIIISRPLAKLYSCGKFVRRFGARILMYALTHSGSALRAASNFPHRSEFCKRSVAVVSVFYMMTSVAATQSMKNIYQVQPGQTAVDVALPENPSTGYRWYLVDYPDVAIASIKYHYQAADEAIPGAQGEGHFVVTLNKGAFDVPMRLAVTLTQARPWEIDKASVQTIYLVTAAK